MKKTIIFLAVMLVLVSLVFGANVMPFVVHPKNLSGEIIINNNISYMVNFSTTSNCNNIVLSYITNVTTNNYGWGSFEVDLNSMTSVPSYICEYSDSNGTFGFKNVHNISSVIADNYFGNNNVTGDTPYFEDWSNVSITESQISDLSHIGNYSSWIGNISGYNCTGTNKMVGININGSVHCEADGGSGVGADGIGDTELNYSDVTLADFTNDVGFFDSINDFTGTLTNTYWCRYDLGNGEIDCDVAPFVDTNLSGTLAANPCSSDNFVTNFTSDGIPVCDVPSGSGDNASFNESLTNLLYADIGISGDNGSFNETLTNGLYASISLIGDNASWNQTLASLLYADIGVTGDNGSFNETLTNLLYAGIGVTGDNGSFNETLTNLLYADIGVTGDNGSFNETLTNLLYAGIGVTGDNGSFNQTLTNTLYADISVTGDNASWNQSVMNTLLKFETIVNDDLLNFSEFQTYNGTMKDYVDTVISVIDIADLNWMADWMIIYSDASGLNELAFGDENGNFLMSNGEGAPSWETIESGDNSSFNETLTNLLYADIGVTGDNGSFNETLTNLLYADIGVIGDNGSFNESLTNSLYPSHSALTTNLSLYMLTTLIQSSLVNNSELAKNLTLYVTKSEAQTNFVNITDTAGGDVSGAFSALQVVNTQGLDPKNITNTSNFDMTGFNITVNCILFNNGGQWCSAE